jgi:hypothetical protein
MKLYIYRNEDIHGDDYPAPCAVINGRDNADCEAQAETQYGINDYSWSYTVKEGM